MEMTIEHIAIWVKDLETMKDFYERYFYAQAGERYDNEAKSFKSYFLSFSDSSTRLELMHQAGIEESRADRSRSIGLTHLAVGVETRAEVMRLTELLRSEGHPVIGEARLTGDGYFESVIADPEGNCIEICCKGQHAG